MYLKVIRSATMFLAFFVSLSVLAQTNPDVAKSDAIAKEWDENYLESAKLYETAAKNYEEEGTIDTLCFYKAGQNYVRANQYQEAIPLLERAIELNYPEIKTWFYLTDALIETGQYEEAQKQLEKALEKNPDQSAEILLKKARMASENEKYEDAIKFANKGLEENPENDKLIKAKAVGYEKSGNAEKAIEEFEKLLELNPDDQQLILRIGILHFSKTDEAYKAERKKYESISNPSRVDYARLKKNQKQIAQGYNDAVKYLEKAHENNPDNKGVMQRLMICYKRLDNEAKEAEMKEKLGM